MELKYIDNISKASDNSLITVINAIQRRLDKNIDKADTRAILAERQEVFIIEAENRKLEIKE
jgi:hypothetical protein